MAHIISHVRTLGYQLAALFEEIMEPLEHRPMRQEAHH